MIRLITGHINFEPLIKVVSAGFLQYKITLLPFVINNLSYGKTLRDKEILKFKNCFWEFPGGPVVRTGAGGQ